MIDNLIFKINWQSAFLKANRKDNFLFAYCLVTTSLVPIANNFYQRKETSAGNEAINSFLMKKRPFGLNA